MIILLLSCAVVVGTPDVGEEITEEVDEDVLEQEEESSCTRLLAAAAERVWDIFVQNKREVSCKKKEIFVFSTGKPAHSAPFL